MKKLKKLITLTALFVLCLALTACGGKKLNLSDYLSISFNGVDGMGSAYLQFDAAQLELDYAGVKDGYPTQKQLEKMMDLASFEFSVNCELDKSENLKNGDKITATITYGKERAKEAKVNVGSTTRTFTVEGLQEPIPIDPFDESIFGEGKTIDFEITGISPYAGASLDNNARYDDPLSNVSYNFENYKRFIDYLAIGDQLTITATPRFDPSDPYVLTRDSITITIDGIDRYADSADDLPADFLRAMAEKSCEHSAAKNDINIYDGNHNYTPWGADCGDIHAGDTALFLPGMDNVLLIPVFKTITVDEWYDMGTGETYTKVFKDVFTYYEINNIVIHPDGSIAYVQSNITHGSYTDDKVAQDLYLHKLNASAPLIEVPLP